VEAADSRELATLADSFNSMAGKLEGVEGSRRRLLTDLAHEIRTPLASMEIAVESLEDGALEPGPEVWRILGDQIDRISRLADDLGQVSAAEEGRLNLDLRSTDPNGLAEAAVLSARDAFERKGVALHLLAFVGDPPPVVADASRIGQVLGNLLTNALRHTPTGGRVEVSVGEDGNDIVLAVTDDGDGIPAEHLPRIFDRFYRVDAARDRDHGGTGVGLAISRAIAHAHAGDLTAVSEGPGRGSTFSLRVPAAAG
jgi:signal transduction histidine kinase